MAATLSSCVELEEKIDIIEDPIPFGYTQKELNEMKADREAQPLGTVYNQWDNVCIHVEKKDTSRTELPHLPVSPIYAGQ